MYCTFPSTFTSKSNPGNKKYLATLSMTTWCHQQTFMIIDILVGINIKHKITFHISLTFPTNNCSSVSTKPTQATILAPT